MKIVNIMVLVLDLHTFLVILLVFLILVLVLMALHTLYQRVFVRHKRRRRYTMYDDSTIAYGMRAPLIKSHSVGGG